MRPHRTLRHWLQQLLPSHTSAQGAAEALLRAFLFQFTTNLAQLARQTDRPTGARGSRQWLARWLASPQWPPERLYARLTRLTRRLLRRSGEVLLLIDVTDLADGWAVLQISLPWQRRALPLYRVVRRYAAPETVWLEDLQQALAWLRRHLPGPARRYVLVADRGFPSHAFVQHRQRTGWRFVLRVRGTWKINHPHYTGLLRSLALTLGQLRSFPEALLGDRTRGEQARLRHSTAHVVAYAGVGQQAPWYLLTSEADAGYAVRLYRTRMAIEQEFRDLKGPWGLDGLTRWQDATRVATFLAWVAVYEWRLAYLWLFEQLATYAPQVQVGGALSWIKVVREWVLHQLRLAAPLADLPL